MKKTFLIIFCFVYFFSSVGVAINLHYCGGKIKSISLTHSDEKTCCGKKMKSKNCCKEKSIVYKVKDSQDVGSKYFSLKNEVKVVDLYFYSASIILEKANFRLIFTPDFHAPPDIDQGSTYLVNRIFRI